MTKNPEFDLSQGFNAPRVVEAYGVGRPAYPDTIVNYLTENGFICDGDVLADIGTGNGRFLSTLFNVTNASPDTLQLEHVHAVDASPNMITEVEARFSEQPRFSAHLGKFQAIPLEDESVNVISCFSSVHWGTYNPEVTRKTHKEFRRVLKPNGRLIVSIDTWNLNTALGKAIRDLTRDASHKFAERHMQRHKAGMFKQWKYMIQEGGNLYQLARLVLKKKYSADSLSDQEQADFNKILEERLYPLQIVMNYGIRDLIKRDFMSTTIQYQADMAPKQIQAEFDSQIYIDMLTDEEKEQLTKDLETFLATKENDFDAGKLRCPRANILIAGHLS